MVKPLRFGRLAVVLGGTILGLSAQAPPNTGSSARVQEQLRALLGPQGIQVSAEAVSRASRSTLELHVQWDATVPPPALPPPPSAAGYRSPNRVMARRSRPGGSSTPAARSVEFGSHHVMVVAVDGNGLLKSWSVIPDPRILRSEGPGPDGVLTGQVVTVPVVDLLLSVPDDPAVAEVRIFEPRFTDNGIILRLVAVLPGQ